MYGEVMRGKSLGMKNLHASFHNKIEANTTSRDFSSIIDFVDL